jgi:general secretion pathway protein K
MNTPIALTRSRPGHLATLGLQRGAALLMAMVIVTLVSTIAASMVWQQWRAVQVEGAERVRSQAAWVLNGALDLGRHFLMDDARRYPLWDDLTEAWATPLPETRLSAFLSADENTNSADEANSVEAFMSGGVTDALAKYSLGNLVDVNGDVDKTQVFSLGRLCENVGVPSGVATNLAQKLSQALLAKLASGGDPAALAKIGGQANVVLAPTLPQRFDDLTWLGLDGATLERLRPYVVLLPPGPGYSAEINLNTAPKEVIAAVVLGLDLGTAARVVQARQRKPFHAPDDIRPIIGTGNGSPTLAGVNIASSWFEVVGRLRYEDFVIEQRSMVERMGPQDVRVHSTSRFSGLDAANAPR